MDDGQWTMEYDAWWVLDDGWCMMDDGWCVCFNMSKSLWQNRARYSYRELGRALETKEKYCGS